MPEGREVRTPRHPLLQRSPRARIGTPPVQRQRPQAPDLTPAQHTALLAKPPEDRLTAIRALKAQPRP